MPMYRAYYKILIVLVALMFWPSITSLAQAPSPVTGRAAPQADKDYEQWREAQGNLLATGVSRIRALPGYEVELLRSAGSDEGSWISMEFDPKGRLYIAKEGTWDKKPGILRFTLPESDEQIQVETINDTIQEARGLLWAYDSLYIQCNGYNGDQPSGLYRMRDADGDGELDQPQLLHRAKGGGHGLNDLALGPDGYLYLIQGDQSDLPEDWNPAQSLVRNNGYDRLMNANGKVNVFKPGEPPFGGRLIRTDRDGKLWQVVAAGMRNPYGIDFNADGEMFTYDADMERDIGLPWYRPTHVVHLISGADYGWRRGTDHMPLYSPDRPPVTCEIGLGSPTCVKFGTRSNFPKKYRDALFILDWAYGRIIAIHLTPDGAGYTGEAELFIDGRPLNVTDLDFGPDGAMYFITGGRGTQSGLYRVRHVDESGVSSESGAPESQAAKLRALRHRLEAFHGDSPTPDPSPNGRGSVEQALDFAWKHIGHSDPSIRHAARIAIEAQPLHLWWERVYRDIADPAIAANGLLAFARKAPPSMNFLVLGAVGLLQYEDMTEDQKRTVLRAIELSLYRTGQPEEYLREIVLGRLHEMYPARSTAMNRYLSELMLNLDGPQRIFNFFDTTLELADASQAQGDKVHFLNILRHITYEWTDVQESRYLQQLSQVRNMRGGSAYAPFIRTLIKDAMPRLSEANRRVAESLLNQPNTAGKEMPTNLPRPFVKVWTMQDLEGRLESSVDQVDVERGRRAFLAVGCQQCHRKGDVGTLVGPDLTQVGARFSRRDILAAIIDPSAAIDEKYQVHVVTTRDGKVHAGQLVSEDNETITLGLDAELTEHQTIEKSRITSQQRSPISPMPVGLLNTLKSEEILDLLAYLVAQER